MFALLAQNFSVKNWLAASEFCYNLGSSDQSCNSSPQVFNYSLFMSFHIFLDFLKLLLSSKLLQQN